MSISKLAKGIKGRLVDVELWAPLDRVDSGALDLLSNVAALPWAFHHVAVMPDVHHGKGCAVGSVIAMKDAVSPAAVGVDIGCGMGAIRTSLRASDLPDSLEGLRAAIEAAIPVGFNSHKEPAWRGPESIRRDGQQLFSVFGDLDEGAQSLFSKATRQLGTLGGGNHFIEVCLDAGACEHCEGFGYISLSDPTEGFMQDKCATCKDGKVEPRVWLMLHSGSRNIGKELAEVHIARARELAHNQALPDRDLAVFLSGTPEMVAYRHDLVWAQSYAMFNRQVMFELLKGVIDRTFVDHPGEYDLPEYDDPILCHHNYVSEETHFGENVIVTRKGAISARQDELGIIPGSMGTKSFIVRGLGNPDSFHSASHGAGRRMSRGTAKRQFTVEDLAVQTTGVCCRKDAGVLDEIPAAYKDIDQVMADQRDLVKIVTTLKGVLCVKG